MCFSIVRFGLLLGVVWGTCAWAGAADEEAVPLDKVPKALLDSVKARFPDAKLLAAGKELDEGKLVYEVTIKDGEHKIDVMLRPEGQIFLIEKAIAARDLPKAIDRAIQAKYPGAKYEVVEEMTEVEKKKETLAYYEVLLAHGDKQRTEVKVSVAGKIVGEEDKSGEKAEQD